MKKYDVIVIGAGSGLIISNYAASRGLKTALIEKNALGGTCLNKGCIPSKILIHSAEIAETINNSHKFGITTKIQKINFKQIIKNMTNIIDPDSKRIEKANKQNKNITLYKTKATFINDKTIKIGKETITAKKIFIFAGTRNLKPPIPGLEKTPHITSTEALRLKKQPKTLTIIGGGYIATELSHFYGNLGTKINIIQRSNLLINREDQEISEHYTKTISKKYNVHLNSEAIKVWKKGKQKYVQIKNLKTRKKTTIKSDEILLAVGRTPNTDELSLKKTNIKLNNRGYIKTNQYLETNVKGIWAGGDIAGKYLFKHSANLEAEYCIQNAFTNKKQKVNYAAMPHAIFTSPQIAGVGFTEQELKNKKTKYLVGKHYYKQTGMGIAMKDEGFVKILVDKKSKKILGCHIIGSQASTLIHEVLVAMRTGKGTIDNITRTIHIHPALSEVVQRAANSA